jgi:hypothetical protein
MMFELLLDVTDRFLDLRNTNADSNHRIDAHTCTSHTVPYGTALLGWRFPRHFVPGYDQPVPPGQKPFAHRSGSQLS